MKKAPRMTRSVEMIYVLVVGSLHYWGALIHSGVIYGFAEAATCTLNFLQQTTVFSPINGNIEQRSLAKASERIPFGKVLSFIWIILFSMCLASLLAVYNEYLYTVSSFLAVISLTLFSIYHTFLVLAISLYNDKKEVCNGKWLYAYTLDYLVRNPFKSLFVLMLTWSAMGIAYFNLVLFFFLVPSLYWMIVQKGLQVKTKER